MNAPEPTGEQILAVPMGGNDADAATIREYLVELAAAVWRQGEGFSGKRPFGNSETGDGELMVRSPRMPQKALAWWGEKVPAWIRRTERYRRGERGRRG